MFTITHLKLNYGSLCHKCLLNDGNECLICHFLFSLTLDDIFPFSLRHLLCGILAFKKHFSPDALSETICMKRQIFLLTLSCHYHGRIVAKSHKKVTSFHRISMEIQAHKEFIFCETYVHEDKFFR